MSDFTDGIVTKPWGYEYLMFQNEKIGIWFLHILEGKRTSLHCHPGKKTGYILLEGEAEVSFLSDSTRLKSPGKLMIREGLFHSTKAVSLGGVRVIEVESPPDKNNLVRLEDAYGRQDKPYEGPDALVPMTGDCITLAPPSTVPVSYLIGDTRLVVELVIDKTQIANRPDNEIMLVLDGGLFSKQGDPVLSPGDVIVVSTFNRLAQTFDAPGGIAIMSVCCEAPHPDR